MTTIRAASRTKNGNRSRERAPRRSTHYPSTAGQNSGVEADESVEPGIDGAIPFSQRFSCTVAEACDATGLGRTKLYELIGAGELDTTTIGRRRLISVRSLQTLVAAKKA
jgi:excisionase family DNA binding protein